MNYIKGLTLLLAAGAMMGVDAQTGGRGINEAILNDPSRYKGKGFSGGQSKMREFVIDGFIIKATNLKMAKKKYAAMKK